MLSYSTLNFKENIKSEYLQEDICNLLDHTFIIPSSYAFNAFEVTEDYVARPDLVSYDAYGDSMFADVICKLNGIGNPFELNKGMILILPSPENIMDFVMRPDVRERDENWGVEKNLKAKNKKSKRQANEAIVGDTRFKIDSTSGIIIY